MQCVVVFNKLQTLTYLLHKLWGNWDFSCENIDEENEGVTCEILKRSDFEILDKCARKLKVFEERLGNKFRAVLIEFAQSLHDLHRKLGIFHFVNKHRDQPINQFELWLAD